MYQELVGLVKEGRLPEAVGVNNQLQDLIQSSPPPLDHSAVMLDLQVYITTYLCMSDSQLPAEHYTVEQGSNSRTTPECPCQLYISHGFPLQRQATVQHLPRAAGRLLFSPSGDLGLGPHRLTKGHLRPICQPYSSG
jgi:hypothetical protein